MLIKGKATDAVANFFYFKKWYNLMLSSFGYLLDVAVFRRFTS